MGGDVFSRGRVAPGLPEDLPPAEDNGGIGVNTGVVTAITFNFAGIQDNAPLTNTSVLNENLQLTSGLNFGPGLARAARRMPVTSSMSPAFSIKLR